MAHQAAFRWARYARRALAIRLATSPEFNTGSKRLDAHMRKRVAASPLLQANAPAPQSLAEQGEALIREALAVDADDTFIFGRTKWS